MITIYEINRFGLKQGTKHLGNGPGLRTLCGLSSPKRLSLDPGLYYTGREHKPNSPENFRLCPECAKRAGAIKPEPANDTKQMSLF